MNAFKSQKHRRYLQTARNREMQMISIQFDECIRNPEGSTPVDGQILENAAVMVLDRLRPVQDFALSLVITGDQQVRELNRQYLGIDENTDVLSFTSGEVDPDDHLLYLGDVIIAYPTASQQAIAAGHPVEAELQLLVVHGVLHLLGYDHLEPHEKTVMWSLQDEILTSLGCPARPV